GEEPGVGPKIWLATAARTAAAGYAPAGRGTGILIDAKPQAQGVDGGGHRAHAARKTTGVGLQVSVTVPILQHPTVIDGDGVVAPGRKSGSHERAGVGENR